MEKTNIFLQRNPSKAGQDSYDKELDYLLSLHKMLKKMLVTYQNKENFKPKSGMPEMWSSAIQMEYIADFEAQVLSYAPYIDNNLRHNIYFDLPGTTEFLADALQNFLVFHKEVDNILSLGFTSDLEEDFLARLTQQYADINYGIYMILHLFDYANGNVFNFLKAYTVQHDLCLSDLAEEMYEDFLKYRPSLNALLKFPELLETVEEKLSHSDFCELLEYGDYMELEDVRGICDGTITDIQKLIEDLEERRDSEELPEGE